ncbi:hypothetical protein PI124_g21796 [Phytophthora idaei]|nr:hypothetical protein PI126_g21592 [Phytophthora idaei]KAG3233126.1 hypothetical protein PI124_g21796 [Phytophthora idaei]
MLGPDFLSWLFGYPPGSIVYTLVYTLFDVTHLERAPRNGGGGKNALPPPDLRVTALVRPPRQHESSGGSDASEYAASAVSSDEEWVDSSAEVSSTTRSGTSQSNQGRSEGFDHPRSVQGDEQDGEQLEVAAPRLQRSEFQFWEDLVMYLAEYMKDTYQLSRPYQQHCHFQKQQDPLVRFQAASVACRVGELRQNVICTHSGKYKPRGKGKRKRLQSRAMECGAQINACVQVEDESVPTFVLRITTARLVHNHHVNKRTFNQYPHNRNALEPDVVTTVNELRKAGAENKRILKYIHDNYACNPSNQDVHNLVRKLKKKHESTATTSAKRLKKWMIEFSEGPGNVGRIFVDTVREKTIGTCITLQTKICVSCLTDSLRY